MKNEQLDAVGIWIGTKQGDQMSPILFNSSMDTVTVTWNEEGCGFQYCLKN